MVAVLSEEGVTKIGPVDEAGRSALASNLYTPGDLLRLSQLVPDPARVEVIDQPKLAAVLDLYQARSSPSFDKLWRILERLIGEAAQ